MIDRCLTFDLDWAPDWAIADCVAACRAAGVPATFFVTHEAPSLAGLSDDPLFELGIHPNFNPNTTHGETPTEILRQCLRWAPDARAMRTHSLYQSSRLFELIADEFPQIEIDVSLLLPRQGALRPFEQIFRAGQRRLCRVPYNWEDDVALMDPGWGLEAPLPEGLVVFDFHPILVALNLEEIGVYSAFRDAQPRPLTTISRAELAPHVSEGFGVGERLRQLLEVAAGERHRWGTISQLVDERGDR